MSHTIKGSPKLGNVPKSFKRLQNSSQKMKLKENTRVIVATLEGSAETRIPNSHSWNWL